MSYQRIIDFSAGVGGRGEARLFEEEANGKNYIAFLGASDIAASFQLTFPDALPSVSSVLESDADGVLTFIPTPAGGGGNTLDAAYDQGGAGAGRIITADTGAVQIDGSNQLAVDINQAGDFGCLELDKDGTGIGNVLAIFNAGAGTAIDVTQDGFGVLAIFAQNTNADTLRLNKLSSGSGNDLQISNSGTGAGVRVDQSGNGMALDISSIATSSPLINLGPINTNTRGDIAFGTSRSLDPSAPSEGDVWYNSTFSNLVLFDGVSNVDLTVQAGADTQNTLDEAYDEGGAGAGRTISAGAGAFQVDGSNQLAVDINQAGNFGCLELDKNGTGAGTVLKINNAGTGLDIEGEGATWAVDSTGDATFNRVNQPFQSVSAAASTTLDWVNGNHVLLDMDASITTLTLSNPRDGERYLIKLTQDGTGSFTVTWPSTVLWKGGVAPTLGGANVIDVVSMIYDLTNDEYLADAGNAFS